MSTVVAQSLSTSKIQQAWKLLNRWKFNCNFQITHMPAYIFTTHIAYPRMQCCTWILRLIKLHYIES